MWQVIKAELKTHGIETPNIFHAFKAFLFNPSFLAVLCYRLSSRICDGNALARLASRMIWRYAYTHCGCDISPRAQIGDRFHCVHPLGVVIGSGVIIGDDVHVYQNATLGQRTPHSGFPHIKNGATIGAGACVLGDITIGDHAVIGANAVALSDVADHHRAIGIPAVASLINPPNLRQKTQIL